MAVKDLFLYFCFIVGIHMVFGAATTQSCSGNTAKSRTTWCNYDIHTDYDNVVPNTGVTREYWFDIREEILALTGFSICASHQWFSTGAYHTRELG